jgi:EAL domain-containing protein (putative c-di-GMP-specific phosphodiesterase class I)
VTTSVGIALHSGPGGRPDALLRAADQAMYAAKRAGINRVAHAAESPAEDSRADLEARLTGAPERGELRLVFQPIISASTGTPAGAEALLRWQHPTLGLLSPAAFVPLAEDTDLVVALDTWALRAACASGARAGGTAYVSVNLASRTLSSPRLVETVRAALAESGLPPTRLVLEIVESRSLHDLRTIARHLTEMRQWGVRVALDDFGTGYSSLTWLQHLPVDVVKVDRSLTGMLDDPAALRLLEGIVSMARALHVQVVVEGIETAAQDAVVRAAGAESCQGYLHSRPVPEDEWLGMVPSRALKPVAVVPIDF